MNALASPPDPVSGNTGRRTTWLRGMAWCCAALVLLIIGISAHLRLSQAPQVCDPWPECGQSLAAGAVAQADTVLPAVPPPAARAAHRAAASAALLMVLAMLGLALARRPILWAESRIVLGLLGLALFLAVLGLVAGASTRPAVVLGNLLGGFAMLALSVRLAVTAAPRPAVRAGSSAARWWLGCAIVLALAQISLGGLVSASHSGLSCPAVGACDLSAGDWRAFNPWTEPAPGLSPTHAGGAWLHMTHRVTGLVLAAVLLFLSWRAWRHGHRGLATALAVLPVILAGLGLLMVALGLPLALVLAHNLCAALLLAVLASAPPVYFARPGA